MSPTLSYTGVEQSSRHMTFESFEWKIPRFQVVRVREALSSSIESKLFCFAWPMEDSSSYEVREWIIQVVHAGETILSLEINWTESFWLQGWNELNLSLRLFTCVSVLHITRRVYRTRLLQNQHQFHSFCGNSTVRTFSQISEHSSADIMLVKKSQLPL